MVESKKRVKVVKIDYTSTLAYLGTRCTACIVHMMYHSRYVYAAHIPVHVQTSTLCYNAAQNVLYNISCWPSVKALKLWIRSKNMSPSFPIKPLFSELKTVGSNPKCFLCEYIFIYIFLFVYLFFCFSWSILGVQPLRIYIYLWFKTCQLLLR